MQQDFEFVVLLSNIVESMIDVRYGMVNREFKTSPV